MTSNCILGNENLTSLDLFSDLGHKILYHHENWNGSGFFNVKKDEFPLEIKRDYSWMQLESFITVFMKIIDSKSKFTKEHSSDVKKYTDKLAQYYYFEKERRIKINIAVALYDLGKINISNTLLEKKLN